VDADWGRRVASDGSSTATWTAASRNEFIFGDEGFDGVVALEFRGVGSAGAFWAFLLLGGGLVGWFGVDGELDFRLRGLGGGRHGVSRAYDSPLFLVDWAGHIWLLSELKLGERHRWSKNQRTEL